MDDQRWRRVWDAFQEACALPADQRNLWLESALEDPQEREELIAMLSGEVSQYEQSMFATAGAKSDGHMWPRLGESFGRFLVTNPLGRGGMGEVYEAFDSELQRAVALKFLAADSSNADSGISQFIREAQAASALNHPGIVTVHDVLRTDSEVALVMELIEGNSLRSMCGTAQEVSRIAAWGRQAARALAAAHNAGIVHRDIKPENLMLRPDGLLKVLDFGLAGNVQGGPLSSGNAGIAGTLRYMSPEQLRGEPVQTPSDIFSLGIVLYELATGLHPFATEAARANRAAANPHCDALLIPYAITASDPTVPSRLEPSIPATFDTLLLESLEKDPAKRPSATAMAERLLLVESPTASTRKQTLFRSAHVAGIAALLVSLLSTYFWVRWTRGLDTASPVVIDGEPLTGALGKETSPAFSPDGRQIAYAWDGGEDKRERSIYARLVDGGNPLRLTSGSEDRNPAWSPDASSIAFLRSSKAGMQLMMVPSLGGSPRMLARISALRGMEQRLLSWSTDADELIVAGNARWPDGIHLRLHRLTISSGEIQAITDPPEGADDMEPVLSPDRRKLAFLRRHGREAELYVISSRGTAPRKLSTSRDVTGLSWSADGASLLLTTEESIPRRVLLVLERGGNRGPSPFQLVTAVRSLTITPATRQLAFVQEQRDTNIWAKSGANTTFLQSIASTRSDEDPSISPDGTRIAFTSDRTGKFEIWVSDRDGSNPYPVTSQKTFAGSSAWSPDGQWLAYDTALDGPTEIWIVSAGGGQPRRLLNPPVPGFIPSWSADGSSIYFVGKGMQIWKAPVAGGQPVQVTRNGGLDRFETPDGKEMYFSKGIMARGIWSLRLDGSGEEELVPELASVVPYRSWAVTKEGIYYTEAEPRPVLKLLRFQDRKTVTIAPLARPPLQSERGLAVSADGRLVLYVQLDTIRSQIMVAQLPY